MLLLSKDRVDLWFAMRTRPMDTGLLSHYREILTDRERAGEGRFLFRDDQHRYLITRAMIRAVLSKYFVSDPSAWRFSKNQFGRPYITEDNNCGRQISFNISHSEDLIISGITDSNRIGVDVEHVHREQISTENAKHYLSAIEVNCLEQ